MTQETVRNIANWIYNESRCNTSNGSWITYYDECEERFGAKLTEDAIQDISDCLLDNYGEAIAELYTDDECFDITLYLSYCEGWDGTDDWGCN